MKQSNPLPIQAQLQPNLRPAASSGNVEPEDGRGSVNMGRNWQRKELYLLLCFMEENGTKLKSEKERKSAKIYKNMSEFIQSRNVNQCRSYSRKIINRFKGVDQAVLFLQQILRGEQHQNECKQLEEAEDQRIEFNDGCQQINKTNLQNSKRIKSSAKERQKLVSPRIGVKEKKVSQRIRHGALSSAGPLGSQSKEQNQDKEQLKPTGVDYQPCQQHLQSNNSVRDHLQMTILKRTSRKSVFDSENFDNTHRQQPQKRQIKERKKQTLNENISTKEVIRDYQWLQCHNLYLNWQMKLSQTMEQSSFNHFHNLYFYPGT